VSGTKRTQDQFESWNLYLSHQIDIFFKTSNTKNLVQPGSKQLLALVGAFGIRRAPGLQF
jgi:hypothetical protein